MTAEDVAAVVAAVWVKVLEDEHLDPDAGFFDLGADSFMVVQAIEELRERWPGLRVVDVFAHPTVNQLAGFLAQRGTGA